LLGEIWRAGAAGPCGWSLNCVDACGDHGARWCRGKALWVDLAKSAGRELADGGHGLLESFLISEIEASGVNVSVDLPWGRIKVGPGGQISWGQLVLIAGTADAPGILRVLGTFAGKLEKIEHE
jgi:hypothetical protein